MLSPIIIGILIQVSVVVILCVGFTFTYMMEKFPNFAHTSFATLGTMFSYTLVKINGFNPYQAIPFSMLTCGFLCLTLYLFVVRPIKATGAREITLTFAFFALAEVIASILKIYSYWFATVRGTSINGFYFFTGDFTWQGYPGVLLVAFPLCLILVFCLYFFLTRTKQGIAFRAVAENETLSSSLGVNVEAIHMLSWFLTGLLAGLAGGIIPFWKYSGLDYNDEFLILVMTGSIMGGLSTVAGAIIGGVLVVISQKTLTLLAIEMFGIGTVVYESIYPMLFVVILLFLQPEGIMGAFDKTRTPSRPLRIRVTSVLAQIRTQLRRLTAVSRKITLFLSR